MASVLQVIFTIDNRYTHAKKNPAFFCCRDFCSEAAINEKNNKIVLLNYFIQQIAAFKTTVYDYIICKPSQWVWCLRKTTKPYIISLLLSQHKGRSTYTLFSLA